jgi:hypothetical protein
MKPTSKLFTDIAREHLRIATLETRRSDALDFHDVSVWGVRNALAAAYEAGVNACEGIGTGALEQDVPRKMLTALQMASNYMADDLDETDETEMRVFDAIRAAIAKATAVSPPSGSAAATAVNPESPTHNTNAEASSLRTYQVSVMVQSSRTYEVQARSPREAALNYNEGDVCAESYGEELQTDCVLVSDDRKCTWAIVPKAEWQE